MWIMFKIRNGSQLVVLRLNFHLVAVSLGVVIDLNIAVFSIEEIDVENRRLFEKDESLIVKMDNFSFIVSF